MVDVLLSIEEVEIFYPLPPKMLIGIVIVVRKESPPSGFNWMENLIDFVFVCHEPKQIQTGKEPSILARSRSALQNSSTSDDVSKTRSKQTKHSSLSLDRIMSIPNRIPFLSKRKSTIMRKSNQSIDRRMLRHPRIIIRNWYSKKSIWMLMN